MPSFSHTDEAWAPGFTIAPYGWLVTVGGEVGALTTDETPGMPGRLDVELNDDYDDGGFMLYGDWRSDKWMVFADAVWIHASQSANAKLVSQLPGSNIDALVDAKAYQVAGGYRVSEWDNGSLVLYAGLRRYTIEIDLDAQDGILPAPVSFDESQTWTDGVLGAHVGLSLSDKWRVTLMGDIGAGQSEQSWQLLGSVGYSFSWGKLLGGYRYMAIEYEGSSYLADLTLSGPMIGVAFSF
jgi:hypothetical protein